MTALVWAWGAAWLAAASLAGWPWVQGLKPDPEPEEWRVMRWPLAVGLGLGALTLWLVVAGFWRLNVWVALAFPTLLLAAWAFSSRHALRTLSANSFKVSVDSVRSGVKQYAAALRRAEAAAWVAAVGLATLAVVVAQSTYYPFIGEDEISRYAYYARLMFVRGQVTGEVRGYPMFLPAAYAFVFLVTGQLAEQLARLVPAALSAMTVLAGGALAHRWYGRRAGWAAAFALTVTPLYVRWSPDGYIDIPSALYFVLGAYAAEVWRSTRRAGWAAMAGGMAGLALWTKQAGFAALACLGLVFAWTIVRDWTAGDRRAALAALRGGLLALAAAFVCGGWWYVRNTYYDGWAEAVPGPGPFYYQQAVRDPATLIPFVGEFRAVGAAASVLYLAGLAWSAVRLRRAAWPLIWCVPYTILWWWLFSYDARFLLTVLPFYAALFGGLVSELRFEWTGFRRWGIVAVIAAMTAASLLTARLGGLRQWLVAPGATYAGRLYRAKGDMYRVVEYLRDNTPASARVVSMDGRLVYYLIERDLDVLYPTRMADLAGYDYFVVGYWWSAAYAGFGTSGSEVAQELRDPTRLQAVYIGPQNSLTVYRILKP
jgi:hypothetical protein